MKKINNFFIFLASAMLLYSISSAEDSGYPDNYVMNAMRAEMARSMEKLQMDKLDKPYFMSYTVSDGSYDYFEASFGALLSSSEDKNNRIVKAEARIGNASFDSTLFVSDPYGNYSPYYVYSAKDGNYDSLRFSLWKASDAAYKGALDAYSKKAAFVQSKNITELYDDLVPAERQDIDDFSEYGKIDKEWAKNLVRSLSAVFKNYPEVINSYVSISQGNYVSYYLNSENTRFRRSSCYGALRIGAAASTQDGYSLPAFEKIEFCDAKKELPSYGELAEKVKKLAENLSASVKSSVIKAYIGPVMFEKAASAEFFEALFVNNAANPREVWRSEGQWSKSYIYSRAGELDERLGMRVMPPFLSAYDDPSAKNFNGTFLAGSYSVDDEGVPAQKVTLVQRGILKDYYRFRSATRDFRSSNGHGRGEAYEAITGAPGNVFISPDQRSRFTVSSKDMKKKLISMCKEQELEYCLIVRYMPGLYSVFNAYKLYPDGHEEPVHALQFTGTSLRALRDIAYASRERSVFSLAWSPDASIICPDIIVREMEVRKTSGKPPKKPYLPHPYFGKERQ